MSLKIDLSPAAVADVMDIAEYLAERSNYDTSDNFLRATDTAYRQLADFPGLGASRNYRPEFPGLRMWPVPKFANYLSDVTQKYCPGIEMPGYTKKFEDEKVRSGLPRSRATSVLVRCGLCRLWSLAF